MIEQGEGNEYTEEVRELYWDVGTFERGRTPKGIMGDWRSYAEGKLVDNV